MGRSPCCDDQTGLKKGPWTPEEDQKLISYIKKHGHGSWRALPKLAGLNRCGKSCRLRWTNYLRPDIKRGKFTPEEEQTILNLHSVLGNKWSTIASHLPGRTDNEIKNYWNTHLKKKLIHMGFDPMTHRPRNDIFSSLSHLIALANLNELMEHHSWEHEALRQQNEVVQMAKLQSLQNLIQPPHSMASQLANNINNFLDVDTYNLLSSLSTMKDTPTLSLPHLENIISSSLGTHNDHTTFQAMHDSIPFSHLPALKTPESFETSPNMDTVQGSNFNIVSKDENSPTSSSPWLPSTISPSPPVVAPVAETSVVSCLPMDLAAVRKVALFENPIGNVYTISSLGGASSSSMWQDLLLDDQLFHEIA